MEVMGLAEEAVATTWTGEATVVPFFGELMVTPANETAVREIVTVKRLMNFLKILWRAVR
jgi:hypothetical protein